MRAALVGLLLATVGFDGVAGAQVRARPTLRVDRLDARKPPALQLYVSDLDSTGAAITDRQRKSYRLLVDGLPQSSPSKARRFGELNEPIVATLVIQVSPTLRDVLTEAVEGGKRFIDALPAGSKVGLVAFTDVVVQDVRPAPPAEVKRALDDLRIREDAVEIQLPDAVRDALEGLTQTKGSEARALVLLSDGLTANLDFAVFAELGARAKDKGVSVHSIGYAPLEPARLRTLFELSRTGAGTFREAKDPAGVVQAFDAVGDQLLNQQVLSFSLPKIFDGKLHDFQLELEGGEGSNIVSAELAAFAMVDEAAPGRRAAWLVFAIIAIVLLGGTVGTWWVLRWRAARALPQRVAAARSDDADDEDDERDEDELAGGGVGADEDASRASRHRFAAPVDLGPLQAPAASAEPLDPRGMAAREQSRARPLPGQAPAAFDPGAARRNIDLLFAAGDRSVERRTASAALAAGPLAPAASPLSEYGAAQAQPPTWGSAPAHAPNSGLVVLAPPAAAPVAAERPAPEAFPAEAALPAPSLHSPSSQGAFGGFRLPLPDPDGSAGPPLAEQGHGPALRLPDPEDYLRRVAHAAPAPALARPAAVPGYGAPLMAPAPAPAPAPAAPLPASAPAPAGAAPFLAVQPLAAEGVQPGRMLDRKTAVLAVEQITDVDFSAWIVPLDQPTMPTIVVGNGFRLAAEAGAELRLPPEDAPGLEGTICLDSRGYRVELRGAQGQVLAQPLNDGDSFNVGARRFLFKLAARFPQRQLAAARLEVLTGLDQGRSLGLRDGVACALGCHPSNAFVIRGEGVGERHAVVLRKDKGCIVADLGAEGGVWYQGQRIGQQTVMPGEEFAVGAVRLLFTVEA
ncbi:MAG: FHA domain-containing protein [Proteobacteria bacterium]|nr:FHA domain-containing protein [Pseudomonadota bacterium]